MAAAGFGLAEQTAGILVDSSFLPGSPPRDPMDRIVVATAREHGLRLVTRDCAILAYASAGQSPRSPADARPLVNLRSLA
jgi:PIN domain nuclease of toxin-antitoxin system